LVIGDAEGSMIIEEVIEETSGYLNQIAKRSYNSNASLLRCQWYPWDSGIIALTYHDKLKLIDTNNLAMVESFAFSPSKLFWSDWNAGRPNLIAVGTSPSTIRFVDVRSGDALQSITVPCLTGHKAHSVTRVLWTPLDDECIIVGDSAGYIHVFDIRAPRKSVQSVNSEKSLCEAVVCLTATKDKMNFITCHGLNYRLNMWTLKNGKLINANIHYPCLYSRFKTTSKSAVGSAFLKCQTYVTDDYIFNPTPDGCGEIGIYNLHTGDHLGILTPSTYNPFNTYCVNGLNSRMILYSGSRRCLRTWSVKMRSDHEENLKKFYEDNWSDSD
ncbi:DNA excision repair protein ERCC-8-like protein, partial [Dinothrombium tinctorium]